MNKELLESAAAAMGLRVKKWGEQGYAADYALVTKTGIDSALWNPIISDSDAFRLETACRLEVRWGYPGWVEVCGDHGCFAERFSDHGGDRLAARRYASTRAAANFGPSA